jgi:glycosyltransferase involved in cell wall biosynthesis
VSETDSKLSVIVPAYNSGQTLADCLDALLRARRYVHEAEIFVVDDGSTDDTALIASRYNVNLLQIRSNSGPAAARNLGAAQATGNILVFVDADVAISEDALKRIAAHFKKAQSAGAVIGSYDDSPSEKNLISRYRNLLHHFVHQNAPKYSSHFWTGLGALRKSDFDAIVGFNEDQFGRTCEDIELGYRLRANGCNIAMDKELQGKHLKHWTLLSMVRTDLFIRAIPWTRLLIQYKHIPYDFSLGRVQRLSVALAWLTVITAPFALIPPHFAIITLLAFIGVNWSFFKFLAVNESILLSVACLPLHILYNFNAGAGFLAGIILASLPKKAQT